MFSMPRYYVLTLGTDMALPMAKKVLCQTDQKPPGEGFQQRWSYTMGVHLKKAAEWQDVNRNHEDREQYK